MNFLLIVLAIGGLVFAGVMLSLASRASRMERESDARVHRLHTMATGSVLFYDPVIDEAVEAAELVEEAPQPAAAVTLNATSNAHPFVMTVPAGAGRVSGSFDRTSFRSQR